VLTLYRRHLTSCDHKDKGRTFKRCKCPIWIQGTVAGHQLRYSLDVTSWERAEELKLQIANGTQPKEEGITINEALDKFIVETISRNLSPSTLGKYRLLRDNLATFGEQYGISLLSQCDREALQQFRSGRPLSPRTASKELERIRAFFNYCVANEWITKNPAKAIKAPQIRDCPTLPFTDLELSKILSAVDFKAAVFFRVLLHSGLRIIDAASLRPERIENGKLFLYQQKTGIPVRVPLPPDLLADLGKLPLTGGHYFMVGSENPETICKYYRAKLLKAAIKTGLVSKKKEGAGRQQYAVHPHRFRDTFACNLLLKGVPLETVSILLGHTDIKTTQKSYSPWIQGLQDNLEIAVARTWEQPKLVRVK
jgi:integrase/recombinase XerD